MKDDLVKRLRKWDSGESTWGLLEDAADRIEELERYQSLHAQCEKVSLEHEKKLVEQLKIVHSRLPQWRPIETAPMDGEIILVYGAFYDFVTLRDIYFAYWEEATQSWEIEGEKIIATHWMPLPEPPQ